MTILTAIDIVAEGIISKNACERTVHELSGLSGGYSASGYDIHIREGFTLWPMQFKLGSSIEKFKMPNTVMGVVHDKSSLARRGLSVFNSTIEAGWGGYLTIELVNRSWSPIKIYAGQPIAQIVFHELKRSVAAYRGRYNNQPAMPVSHIRAKATDL
jgi:dCTP deaminase